jgi:hypothetical protein
MLSLLQNLNNSWIINSSYLAHIIYLIQKINQFPSIDSANTNYLVLGACLEITFLVLNLILNRKMKFKGWERSFCTKFISKLIIINLSILSITFLEINLTYDNENLDSIWMFIMVSLGIYEY